MLLGPVAVDGAVDRGPSNVEQLSELCFFPRSRPLAFATAIPSLVLMRARSASNSATMESGEQQPPDRVGGVVDRAADVQLHFAGGELIGDGAGVGHRASQSIKLRDREGVPQPSGIASGGRRGWWEGWAMGMPVGP